MTPPAMTPTSTPTSIDAPRGRVPACRSSSSLRTGSRRRRLATPTSSRRGARSPGTPKPRAAPLWGSRRGGPGRERRRRRATTNGLARGTRPAPWTVSTGGTSSSASGSDAPRSSASGTRSAAAGWCGRRTGRDPLRRPRVAEGAARSGGARFSSCRRSSTSSRRRRIGPRGTGAAAGGARSVRTSWTRGTGRRWPRLRAQSRARRVRVKTAVRRIGRRSTWSASTGTGASLSC
mmetsp:Transcript_6006/g.24791  ORF Transcript_6006/g.24791 Transcript_6006/m.24791 type:complete len:234 (-) Transcript_6006:283-984(-)